MQPPPPSNLEAIREAVHKPCPKIIDRESSYPRGYIILGHLSLFSGEDRQSTLEHVAMVTI